MESHDFIELVFFYIVPRIYIYIYKQGNILYKDY